MGNLNKPRGAKWLTDMFTQPQTGPHLAAAVTEYHQNLIYTVDRTTGILKNPGAVDEVVAGVCSVGVKNTGAAGARKLALVTGVLELDADATNPPTLADAAAFRPAYATSNHEISRKRGTGSLAGIIMHVEGAKVFAWVGPPAVAAAQALLMRETVRTVTAGPVTVSLDDHFVALNFAVAGAAAVAGPVGASLGHEYAVHDLKGDAAANNITITPAAGETINGAATLVINANRATRKLKKVSATDWTLI